MTNTTVQNLLKSLREHDIKLSEQEGKLIVSDPQRAITPSLLSQIKLHKEAILDLLRYKTRRGDMFKTPIAIVERHSHYALSNAQRRLWVLDQLGEKRLAAYNIPSARRIKGDLNIKALEKALQTLIARHEILRTRFEVDTEGTPYQVVEESFSIELPVLDWQDRSEVDLEVYITAHANQVFDLTKRRLLQVELLQIAPNEHILLFNIHHIISDGWSMEILFRELSTLYQTTLEDSTFELPSLRIQYKDYAAWQLGLLADSERIGGLREYWQNQLGGIEPLELPTDYARPLVKSYEGDRLQHQFDEDTLASLQQLSRKAGGSLFMTLTALVKVLLYRYTNQTDIVIGTPTAGRNHPDLHDQIGFYVNTLVLRDELNGADSFLETLEKVKQTALAAFDRDWYPFDQLVEELETSRDQSRNPLFDVMLVLQNNEQSDFQLGDTIIEEIESQYAVSKFDLTFSFVEQAKRLILYIEYSTVLFKKDRIEQMVQHLEQLIQSVIVNPAQSIGKLDILPEAERELLLHSFNDTQTDYPKDKTIIQLFEEQVEKTPDHIALVFDPQDGRQAVSLTYQQLNERANQLGHYLREKYAIQADDIIALQLERSEWMIVAILGVLKSGAAYLPIDPEFPLERVQYILEDSQAKVLLQDKFTFGKQAFSTPTEQVENIQQSTHANPSLINSPDDLAYIIYTSGSTGKPKGTMLEHQGAVNMSLSQIKLFGLTTSDKILQFANYIFDASIYEIQMTFFSGATLVLPSTDIIRHLNSFFNLVTKHEISVATLPPIFLASLERRELPSLRVMITAGESPIEQDVAYYSQKLRYFNAFGPTESSVCISVYEVQDVSSFPVPIGRPIANTQLYILTQDQQVQPIGIAGELCISGVGLARGYLNNPKLTAEKFIPHPFKEGERLYKTGDLARWLPDGNIEFLRRIDYQLKIRGYRIEAGEIEQVLLQHPNIQSAVVMGQEMGSGKELVAYLVSNQAGMPSLEVLRMHLSKQLPDYMIPSYFVSLDGLPLTTSGKVNRKALPLPDTAHLARSRGYVGPRNKTEATLVKIWEEVLQREGVGVYDNFFELGGHSLKAIRVVALIQQRLSTSLSVRELFTHSTIAGLSSLIASRDVELLAPIPAIEKHSDYALSNGQRSLWVLNQLADKGLTAYNIPTASRVQGALNIEALEKAFRALIVRHEILRTRFEVAADSSLRQIVEESFSFKLAVLSWQDRTEADLETYMAAYANRVFDLTKGVLLQAEVLQISLNEHILLFNIHHIISDGWSMGILFRELSSLYQAAVEGNRTELPVLRIQYKDYTAWQLGLLADSDQAGQLREYWQHQLRGIEPLDLPTDYTRPRAKNYEGDHFQYQFDQDILPHLHLLSRKAGGSLFMTLVALVKVLLYRYTHQTDIAVGTPVSGRNHPDLHDQIGFYVNTLVLRDELNGDNSFQETLEKVKQTALAAFDRDWYPFDQLVKELEIPRDQSRNPLFDVMLVLQNNEQSDFQLRGTIVEQIKCPFANSKFDLTFSFVEQSSVLRLDIEYSTSLFKKDRIERMVQHLEQLIQSVILDPAYPIGKLNILPEIERELLLHTFNDTQVKYPTTKTIIQLFEEQVEKTPDNIALTFQEKMLTYKELNTKANQLIYVINKKYRQYYRKKIEIGTLIGLYIERSFEMIIGILAILKSGGVYIPLDVTEPTDRIKLKLDDFACKLILTDSQNIDKLPDDGNILKIAIDSIELSKYDVKKPPSLNYSSNNLAYVIYTSGTTGIPKGVMIEHRNVTRLFSATEKYYSFTSQDVWVLFHSFSFDFSVWEIWGALLYGGKLVIVDREQAKDTAKFHDLLDYHKVTILNQTPSAFYSLMLVDEHKGSNIKLTSLRHVIFGGEALAIGMLQPWFKKYGFEHPVLSNMYGITETTVHVSYKKLTRLEAEIGSISNIGKKIDDLTVYILDNFMKPMPIGIPGELYIGGNGLARGYLNRPELTVERFLLNPYASEEDKSKERNLRIYKTGDMCHWLPNGEMAYVGRNDDQIKIRGYRIELGEIESKLSAHEDVIRSVILCKGERDHKYLTAYYTSNKELNADVLRVYLEQLLPDYMVPTAFFQLEKMPLTINGKINKKSLPEPNLSGDEVNYVPPTTEIEKQLCQLWQELLKVEKVGITDSFFQLGGNSLNVVRLVSQMQENFEVSIEDVFDNPTIESLIKNITVKKDNLEQHVSILRSFVIEYEKERQTFLNSKKALKRISNYEKKCKKYTKINIYDIVNYKTILVTGVTGYLGLHILQELLETNNSAHIYVIVRPLKNKTSAERLEEKINYYLNFNLFEKHKNRITILEGDLSKPNFDLSQNEYNKISDEVESIIHTAANVKHYGTFEEFYTSNVSVVKNIITFASIGKKKDINHISTISVIQGIIKGAAHVLFSEYDLDMGQDSENYYVKTKFQAEKELESAKKLGVNVKIFRVGNISVNSETGNYQQNIEDNAFFLQLRSFIKIGQVPIQQMEAELSYVNELSKAIVLLFNRERLNNETFHVLNAHTISISDILTTNKNISNIKKVNILDFIDFIYANFASNEYRQYIESIMLHNGWLSKNIYFKKNLTDNSTGYTILSRKTEIILQRIGFEWSKPNSNLLDKLIYKAVETLW